MIDSSAPQTVDQPAQPEQAEAPLSIADHAAVFSPEAQESAKDAIADGDLAPDATTAERAAHHSEQQRREKASGKWQEGKRRASTAVARIGELTGRAKTAEEKLAAAEAELSRYRRPHLAPALHEAQAHEAEQAQPAPPAQTAPRPQAARQTAPDPEPTEADPAFDGDYGKFLTAHARWSARDEYRQIRQQEQAQGHRTSMRQTYETRVQAASAKYQDFSAAADYAIARVPQGSAIETWIFEDDTGQDVLYHFAQQPGELDAILRMPTAFAQVKALALLSQRFAASSQPGSGGTTGAPAERRSANSPPRPPTPVRTEAQRAGVSPPPTDGSLSMADHAKAFRPRR